MLFPALKIVDITAFDSPVNNVQFGAADDTLHSANLAKNAVINGGEGNDRLHLYSMGGGDKAFRLDTDSIEIMRLHHVGDLTFNGSSMNGLQNIIIDEVNGIINNDGSAERYPSLAFQNFDMDSGKDGHQLNFSLDRESKASLVLEDATEIAFGNGDSESGSFTGAISAPNLEKITLAGNIDVPISSENIATDAQSFTVDAAGLANGLQANFASVAVPEGGTAKELNIAGSNAGDNEIAVGSGYGPVTITGGSGADNIDLEDVTEEQAANITLNLGEGENTVIAANLEAVAALHAKNPDQQISYLVDGSEVGTELTTANDTIYDFGAGLHLNALVKDDESTLNPGDKVLATNASTSLHVELQGDFAGFGDGGRMAGVENINLASEAVHTFNATGIEGAKTFNVDAPGITLTNLGAAVETVNLANLRAEANLSFQTNPKQSLNLGLDNVFALDDNNQTVGMDITAAGIEKLQIVSGGAPEGGKNKISLADEDLQELSVSGTTPITITENSSALQTIDATEGNSVYVHAEASPLTKVDFGNGTNGLSATNLATNAEINGGQDDDSLSLTNASGEFALKTTGVEEFQLHEVGNIAVDLTNMDGINEIILGGNTKTVNDRPATITFTNAGENLNLGIEWQNNSNLVADENVKSISFQRSHYDYDGHFTGEISAPNLEKITLTGDIDVPLDCSRINSQSPRLHVDAAGLTHDFTGIFAGVQEQSLVVDCAGNATNYLKIGGGYSSATVNGSVNGDKIIFNTDIQDDQNPYVQVDLGEDNAADILGVYAGGASAASSTINVRNFDLTNGDKVKLLQSADGSDSPTMLLSGLAVTEDGTVDATAALAAFKAAVGKVAIDNEIGDYIKELDAKDIKMGTDAKDAITYVKSQASGDAAMDTWDAYLFLSNDQSQGGQTFAQEGGTTDGVCMVVLQGVATTAELEGNNSAGYFTGDVFVG